MVKVSQDKVISFYNDAKYYALDIYFQFSLYFVNGGCLTDVPFDQEDQRYMWIFPNLAYT